MEKSPLTRCPHQNGKRARGLCPLSPTQIRDTGQKVAMKRFKEAHQDPEVR